MGYAAGNEERLALADGHIHDLAVLDDPNDDVTLELEEVLLRTGHVKVVASVRPADDHHEEAVSVVQIRVTHGWLKLITVLLDPLPDVDRGHDPSTARRGVVTGGGVDGEASLRATQANVSHTLPHQRLPDVTAQNARRIRPVGNSQVITDALVA